jgi:alpha-tubulin suppressor-like RCC1 family protein
MSLYQRAVGTAGMVALATLAASCEWVYPLNGFTNPACSKPADPAHFSDAVALSSSSGNTCALRKGGQVVCWGDNGFGQDGIARSSASSVTRPLSINVPSASGVVAGNSFACSIAAAGGGVWCWGSGAYGVLGPALANNFADNPNAVQIFLSADGGSPLLGATALSSNSGHVCALTGGGVDCWGLNNAGEVGVDPNQQGAVSLPMPVGGTGQATSLSASGEHNCSLIGAPATVGCWGSTSRNQLSGGNGNFSLTPVSVALQATSAVLPPVAACAGAEHSCALDSASNVYCWGRTLYGETGNTPGGITATESIHPVDGLQGGNTAAVACGGQSTYSTSFTCALQADTTVLCFGANEAGQLGRGNVDVVDGGNVPGHPDARPVLSADGVTPLSGATSLALGEDHACAIVCGGPSGGRVVCWGANDKGQLGLGDSVTANQPLAQPVLAPP